MLKINSPISEKKTIPWIIQNRSQLYRKYYFLNRITIITYALKNIINKLEDLLKELSKKLKTMR